jgi:hypothetical protein
MSDTPRPPRVLDSHDDLGDIDRVYVGRPSRWGNRFVVGRDGSRAMVVARFEEWLKTQPALVAAAKEELRGRNLACWCGERDPCHARVWLRIVNS